MRLLLLYCWSGCCVVQLKCRSSSDPSVTPTGKYSLCTASFYLSPEREIWGYYFLIVVWLTEVKHDIVWIFFCIFLKSLCLKTGGKMRATEILHELILVDPVVGLTEIRDLISLIHEN